MKSRHINAHARYNHNATVWALTSTSLVLQSLRCSKTSLIECVFSSLVGIHPLENDVGGKRSSLAVDLGLFTGDQCFGWEKVCLHT